MVGAVASDENGNTQIARLAVGVARHNTEHVKAIAQRIGATELDDPNRCARAIRDLYVI